MMVQVNENVFPLTLQEARSGIIHLNLAFLGSELSSPGSKKPKRASRDGDLAAVSRYLMRVIEDMETGPFPRYKDKGTEFVPRDILVMYQERVSHSDSLYTETGCSGVLWGLCPWRYTKPFWVRPRKISCNFGINSVSSRDLDQKPLDFSSNL